MIKIGMICTGNTCRSPVATAWLEHFLAEAGRTDVEVLSAGTGPGPGYRYQADDLRREAKRLFNLIQAKFADT